MDGEIMVRRPGFPVELKSRRCSEPIILLKISDAKIYFRPLDMSSKNPVHTLLIKLK